MKLILIPIVQDYNVLFFIYISDETLTMAVNVWINYHI